MTEESEPETKYMGIAENYGAKKPKKRGTPCRCKKCSWKTKIRLQKGTSLKKLLCWNCGSTGFERYTTYDQERKNNHETKPHQ